MRPLLIVMSAPSGAGKTTLCDRLLQDYPEITYSVSCTTRPPRGLEEDGVDYFFLTPAAFAERVAAGRFMEHATVHGNRYGTLREPVEEAMAEGQSVLMDIDVEGASQVRTFVETLPEGHPMRAGFVDIFIRPPSLAALRARIEGRGEDSEDAMDLRLENAAGEMARAGEFGCQIVNDHLETAYRELIEVIEQAARG
jgi:guanylate kinase